MKEQKVFMMDEDDKKLCGCLQEFGFDQNMSRIILYLLNNRTGISKDIEKATDLRQPEVSVGIRRLRQMKFVEMEELKKESKGRPIHKYSLKMSMNDIKRLISGMADERIKNIQENVKQVLALLDGIKQKKEAA